jgi:hypothetical protein
MALVLEGYTLRYEDEVTLIAELADEVSVGASELWRVQVRPPYNTVLFFGAIHYFPDYGSLLHKTAAKTRQAAYIEFTFSEREHDTSNAPGYIRAWADAAATRSTWVIETQSRALSAWLSPILPLKAVR